MMAASSTSTDWLLDGIGLSDVSPTAKEELQSMQMSELMKLSEEDLENTFAIASETDRLTVLQRIQVASKQRENTGTEQSTGTGSHELLRKTAILKGWLYKQGLIVKNWKLRWFYLDHDKTLHYYTTPQSTKVKGKVSLDGYSVVDDPQSKKAYAFRLVHMSDKAAREWQLSALDEIDMQGHFEDGDGDYDECPTDDADLYDEPVTDGIQSDKFKAKGPRLPPAKFPASAKSGGDGTDEPPPPPPPRVASPHSRASGSSTYAGQTAADAPGPPTGIADAEAECAVFEFFYKDCSRLEAEAILQSKSNGAFLLRQGAPGNPVVVSGVWYGRCWHYKIFHKLVKGYFLAPNHRGFATVKFLLEHYMSASLPSPANAPSNYVALLVSSVLLQR